MMPALPFLAAAFQQRVGDGDGSPAAQENSLLLWNVFDLNTPVHTFVGHDDGCWSSSGGNRRKVGGGTVGQFPPAPIRVGCMILRGRMWKQGWLRAGVRSPAPNCRWVIGVRLRPTPGPSSLSCVLCSLLSCLEGASKRLVALLLGHLQS